ncbi:hypothetical protein [Chryseolinea lacunae]|uniref:Uncharacterized protein n=1 Tax=Chryseolinea lacunae TaxID=2801331 RepID=A0ABS1KNG5_9BACT|nr:hypothetical protein [Chryseolinea lacunae]MBL0741000.1 hypothetical protein [Chryseolinea lacunae]
MEQEPIEPRVDVERSWFYTLSPCVMGSALCLAGALYQVFISQPYGLVLIFMFIAALVMLMATDYVVKLFVKSNAYYVWWLELGVIVVMGVWWWFG